MVPIFCNNCYKKRDLDNPLQLTRCYHVVCDNCIQAKSSVAPKICPVCKIRTNGMTINRDMPRNVANYFADANEYLKMYRSISKFQCEQRARYYNHYYEQQKGLSIKKEKLQGFVKMEAQMRQQIEVEKKRIAELRNYNNYYNSCDEVSPKTDMPGTSLRRVQRPRTPAFNSSSSTTAADNQNASLGLRKFKQLMLAEASLKETSSNAPRVSSSSSSNNRKKGTLIFD